MWDITMDMFQHGIETIYANILQSILKMWRKPIGSYSSNAIVIQFLYRNVKTYCVKYFLGINKYTQAKFPLSSCSLILSVKWIKAWDVEYFCLKPNCKSYITLFNSKKLYNRLHISLSSALSIFDGKDIGL